MIVGRSFIWKNGNCNGKAALGVAVDLYVKDHVDAYIGLPCSIGNVHSFLDTKFHC